ncbi:enoyl-CoA hydratase/isomerase family protein [Rhodococcus sp. NBC_00294]|uniref:enoyl-CoA hydratase/isomerase family protein n=1 Tax=Rhodococcus sp. NBC_00294 TaxID=2976004 RepID=UPI002E2BD289|nr:enoyl-CoA hydratase-related protein [Rhodococcus sp. NBC_00294]
MASSVNVSIADGAAEITIANPGARNAIDATMARDLVDACDRIDADASVGVAIVRGDDGYFCSGGSRSELAAISSAPVSDEGVALIQTIYDAFLRVGRLRVPTIAAIRGGAVGAGVNLAMATDVRIISCTARFTSGFVNIGIHPGGGHYTLLGRSANPEAATALGVLGDSVDGARAVELGLAYLAVADESVEPEAWRLTETSRRDPALARAAIASLRAEVHAPGVSWDAAVAMERGVQAWSFARKGAARWAERKRAD